MPRPSWPRAYITAPAAATREEKRVQECARCGSRKREREREREKEKEREPAAALLSPFDVWTRLRLALAVGDLAQGALQLLAAVASSRPEEVPRRALRVHAHERRLRFFFTDTRVYASVRFSLFIEQVVSLSLSLSWLEAALAFRRFQREEERETPFGMGDDDIVVVDARAGRRRRRACAEGRDAAQLRILSRPLELFPKRLRRIYETKRRVSPNTSGAERREKCALRARTRANFFVRALESDVALAREDQVLELRGLCAAARQKKLRIVHNKKEYRAHAHDFAGVGRSRHVIMRRSRDGFQQIRLRTGQDRTAPRKGIKPQELRRARRAGKETVTRSGVPDVTHS